MELWTKKMILSKWGRQPPALPADITEITNALGICIPSFQERFLLWSNGGEGPLGNSYLRVLSCEKIIYYHAFYGLHELMKGYVMLGNDAGSLYFFTKEASANDAGIYMAMAGAFFESETEKIYNSFDDFIVDYDLSRF